MIKRIEQIGLFFVLFTMINIMLFTACTNQLKQADSTTASDMHNSSNSLNWEGTYRGEMPCIDCEAIKTQITLREDLTFRLKQQFLGKSEDVINNKGNFRWSADGSTISLVPANDVRPLDFKVIENA
ncbi:MAG: copper resistance protein NlpE, partial [Fulvivirga sp.]|nr:copper resistance protein NlpE [Fulvivirga sp.]